MPTSLGVWNVTDIAECLPVTDKTRKVLWDLHLDQPFTELPDNFDSVTMIENHWENLDDETQKDIVRAALLEEEFENYG